MRMRVPQGGVRMGKRGKLLQLGKIKGGNWDGKKKDLKWRTEPED